MPVYFDKAKKRYRFTFNRIIGTVRHRATKLLPAGWSQAQADAYDRQESGRLYAQATGIEKERLTLAGAVQLYLDHHGHEMRSRKKAAQHLAQLLPLIEGAWLDETPEIASRYGAEKRGKLSPATIRNRLAYLKAAVRHAYRKHAYGDRDYTERMVLPTVHNERQVYLRLPEVTRLLDNIKAKESRALFTLAFYTGLRWISELLPRTSADLERRGSELWLKVGMTKNRTPRMTPIHPDALWALKYLPFRRNWREYYRDFEKGRKAAGMPHVHAHDLRHSLASAIISSGGTLADVQAALWHESPTSSSRYAHLYPERMRSAILGIGRKNAHRHRRNMPLKRA